MRDGDGCRLSRVALVALLAGVGCGRSPLAIDGPAGSGGGDGDDPPSTADGGTNCPGDDDPTFVGELLGFGEPVDASFVGGDLWLSFEHRGVRRIRRLAWRDGVLGPGEAVPSLDGPASFRPIDGAPEGRVVRIVETSADDGRRLEVLDLTPGRRGILATVPLGPVPTGLSQAVASRDERLYLCVPGESGQGPLLARLDLREPSRPAGPEPIASGASVCRFPEPSEGQLLARGPVFARVVFGARASPGFPAGVSPGLTLFEILPDGAVRAEIDVSFNPFGFSSYGFIREGLFDGELVVANLENPFRLYTADLLTGTVGPETPPEPTRLALLDGRIGYGFRGLALVALAFPEDDGPATPVPWSPGDSPSPPDLPVRALAADGEWLAFVDARGGLRVWPAVGNDEPAPIVRGQTLFSTAGVFDGSGQALAASWGDGAGVVARRPLPASPTPEDVSPALLFEAEATVLRTSAGALAGVALPASTPLAEPCDGPLSCRAHEPLSGSLPGARLADDTGLTPGVGLALPEALRHLSLGLDPSRNRCLGAGVTVGDGALLRFQCDGAPGVRLLEGLPAGAQARASPGGRVAALEDTRVRVFPPDARAGGTPFLDRRAEGPGSVDLAFGPAHTWLLVPTSSPGTLLLEAYAGTDPAPTPEASWTLAAPADGGPVRLLGAARGGLAAVALGPRLRVYDVARETPIFERVLRVPPESATVDGDTLIVAGGDGLVEITLPCRPSP
jgi:hypothetical protein